MVAPVDEHEPGATSAGRRRGLWIVVAVYAIATGALIWSIYARATD